MTTQTNEPIKKSILKTVLLEAIKTLTKVGVELLLGYVGGLFAFGATAGFLNFLEAGYAVGGLVAGTCTAIAAKTLVKDFITMPKRIQKQQKQMQLENRLTALEQNKEQQKTRTQVQPMQPVQKMTQNQKDTRKIFNKAFWLRRKKEYNRAA